MSQGTKRSILRWIHIALAIPIAVTCTARSRTSRNTPRRRGMCFFPVLVVTGLWMWKGHAVRRLFSKGSAPAAAAENP
jgi:hypothetical protein